MEPAVAMRVSGKKLDQNADEDKSGSERRKKTTFKLALDGMIFDALKRDVQQEGISLNSKVNVLLQRYVQSYGHSSSNKYTIFPMKSARVFIDLIDPSKLLSYYGPFIKDMIPRYFTQLKIPLTIGSWLECYCNGYMIQSGMIEKFSKYTNSENHLCLVFEHEYGLKWSTTLGDILCQFIREKLGHFNSLSALSESFTITLMETVIIDVKD
jgi:hypothetical protein